MSTLVVSVLEALDVNQASPVQELKLTAQSVAAQVLACT